MEIIFQLLLVLVLILLNGFFVASEYALVSVRKTRINELITNGNVRAELVKKALTNLNSYISATQLGITLASLGLGWTGEPIMARVLLPLFSFLPAEKATLTSHAVAVVAAFTLITFLEIILGELVPKSIALQKAEKTSLFLIVPLRLFFTIFKPFIYLLNFVGGFTLRTLGFQSIIGNDPIHTEEEIKMIISQSGQKGVIEKYEVDMMYKVLQFADIPIQQVMVPRPDVIAFNTITNVSEIIKKIKQSNHSRFPVYEKSIDGIIGFIHIKDIYVLSDAGDADKPLSETKIIREIINALETKPADEVLLEMRKKRIHIAVVNDEYGGTAGIVTLEDIIESIIGDIEDEFEKPLQDLEKQEDGSYMVNGLMPIEQLKQTIKLELTGQGYTTIGGLVFGVLGRSPQKDDKVQIGNILMQVIEVEGKRIKKLLLKKNITAEK